MMRTLFAFIALYVLNVPAYAEMIVFSAEREGVENIVMPPGQLSVEVRDSGVELVSFMIAEVDGNDLEDMLEEDVNTLRRDWVITEANASEYGLDWAAFEMSVNGPNKSVMLLLGPGGTFFERPGPPGLWVGGFQMERIEVTVHYWFWHPVFPALRAYSLEAQVIGEGRFVPEPNAMFPAIGGILALLACRRQTG